MAIRHQCCGELYNDPHAANCPNRLAVESALPTAPAQAGDMTLPEVTPEAQETCAKILDLAGTHREGEAFTLFDAALSKARKEAQWAEHQRSCVYCNQGTAGCDRGRELSPSPPEGAAEKRGNSK